MKKLLFALAILSLIASASAQILKPLPTSVQEFLDERATNEQIVKSSTLNSKPEEARFESLFAPTLMVNNQEMVEAFITFEDEGVLEALHGVGVLTGVRYEDWVTAQIPLNRLEKVARMQGVTNVEISKSLQLCTDSTLNETHAGQVIDGVNNGLLQGYDGTGVIVGVIDSGFDFQHRVFKSNDDTTQNRIVRVYDTARTDGHPALVDSVTTLPGSVYMGEQIDTLTTDIDGGTHGTHTTSIAAGSHVYGYGGMAPGADIVLCSAKSMSETQIINSIKYIYAYADSLGKPCVISLSMSSLLGSHDGKDKVSNLINNSTGPGRIFVIAAGNYGADAKYVQGPITSTQPLNMLLGCYNVNGSCDHFYYYKSVTTETWTRSFVTPYVKFHILNRFTGEIVWESDLITGIKVISYNEFSDYFEPDPSNGSNGYLKLVVSNNLTDQNKYLLRASTYNLRSKSYELDSYGYKNSRYAIGLSVYTAEGDSTYIDSWMANSTCYYENQSGTVYFNDSTGTHSYQNFYASPSTDCSMNSYAVADSAISVGAYVARNKFYSIDLGLVYDSTMTIGQYCNFSSYEREGVGPTGKALPTISAPGYKVIAAGSKYSYFVNNIYNHDAVLKTEDGNVWGIMSGTSMATPTVAGIIAQWLQLDPTLSPRSIIEILTNTAVTDDFTNSYWSGYHFGPNGKIDAMAGIKYILRKNAPMGDVDCNGVVNINDVAMMIDYLLDTVTADDINLDAADCDQNGTVTINDVVVLIDQLLE